ncbi:MAG: hypothetical protein LBG27_04075 [Spirochaetaceae bacterium]|jgi:hypothetical protein|nr:hypothetical protein [Spirochaetaceae bacterium]
MPGITDDTEALHESELWLFPNHLKDMEVFPRFASAQEYTGHHCRLEAHGTGGTRERLDELGRRGR